MELYHRLGEALYPAEIDDLLAEIKDRFGPPPPPVIWLYHLTRIRAFATAQVHPPQIQKHTLEIEIPKGKETAKQTFPLPKIVQPADVETAFTKILETLKK